ncbi:MAG: DNA-directed RNA polymerase subunit beta' [Flavobacteriales bacterium]|mgnify:FL=1|nr:DNA-directed RNA polymerase subunit beta' [Flavobacteriales bacterium]|tara:strand:- start:5107 stop:9414 length:4308 start_codon:yes stop_codon:yes gene_type:complete
MKYLKKKKKNNADFSKLIISVASPESILEDSFGEVIKPETINYRTFKPERDGLFCERIFGPVKDYECHCGKYKRIRYKGIVCDRCGVEVTEKKVRRERIGHIKLVVPVAHIWYFRNLPNKIGYLLGLPTKKLDMIIYYERYVVIQPGSAMDEEGNPIQHMQFLTEDEYFDILDRLPKENMYLDNSDPDKFIAKMGAEALIDLLGQIDLISLSKDLRRKAHSETSVQRKNEALKRLNVVEAFREANETIENKPEWMILQVIPVIPPELRPLVPLDGGRFATSDLNDLYRRVIIRNNRLKRLMEIKAPAVILRNEKRMLQESVDSLLDNTRKASAIKSESNRPLKSLSDNLKGKQGRFRQNLLGKRVDYSARSVIVVGPELEMHECGIPKDMAAELFKPFVARKLIERGIVKTVKSAKKIIDAREPVVWDILENVIKGHPVLLNRAPTLHRLGIQSFQPKLIEGKAIRLHPLSCTAFNADFDGDQMAVHVPLGSAAILEAQLLMLGSHNILNPANGAPITVPSQDMVLGLYYMTKSRRSTKEHIVTGEGLTFYSPEEVSIAYNEGKADLHAIIKVRLPIDKKNPIDFHLMETTVGRVLFNEALPLATEYFNEVCTKKNLRDLIGRILEETNAPTAAKFLDSIKKLGYKTAFSGGLSFSLGDVLVPDNKDSMVLEAINNVDQISESYNMGLITNNERYNQVIDVWTNTNSKLTEKAMSDLANDNQGFNSIYMMLDSGARGSKEQIRQLSGMRGLMAKPQKSTSGGGAIIENPILSNFKEGLSILEYFISTHGARKGLADTALKTADAGYLTRRLVDVAQDVIIKIPDCGTLRGIEMTPVRKQDEIIESISSRIEGRTSLRDIVIDGKQVLSVGDEITSHIALQIEESGIDSVLVRSVLTCELTSGVCAACYGRSLATNKPTQIGEAVGVIAAQSIGEPGTQLTLRTFHIGGVASGSTQESEMISKFDGKIKFEELRSISGKDSNNKKSEIVIGRTGEIKIVDEDSGVVLYSSNIPYGSSLKVKENALISKGDVICEWDPYNAVIISEIAGEVKFEDFEQGITYRIEIDEQTGFKEKVIIETKDKKKIPVLKVIKGKKEKTYNLPVGAHIVVNEGDKLAMGSIVAKIPRTAAKTGDITGGLPRITELFEARNPSNTAIVTEIDGIVSYGKIKRGNREVIIESKMGDVKKYLVPLSKQILVQENDFVKSGMALSDGSISPADYLSIQGANKVQEYLVFELQEVYRLQGVKINDKHFEVIVRQMMRKVKVLDPGDTRFLEGELVHKQDFKEENDRLYHLKIVEDSGDSEDERFQVGSEISARELRDQNFILEQSNKKIITARDAVTAISKPILQGITRASLQTKSFMSAASFQETTKVLNNAAIRGTVDNLLGLKENVIIGHQIPAGTGVKFKNVVVGSKIELEAMTNVNDDIDAVKEREE